MNEIKETLSSRGYRITPIDNGQWVVSNTACATLFGALVLCQQLYVGNRTWRLMACRAAQRRDVQTRKAVQS